MSRKAEQDWLNTIPANGQGLIGIEITGRIVIGDVTDWSAVEEVLESIRAHGAAEVTKTVKLG